MSNLKDLNKRLYEEIYKGNGNITKLIDEFKTTYGHIKYYNIEYIELYNKIDDPILLKINDCFQMKPDISKNYIIVRFILNNNESQDIVYKQILIKNITNKTIKTKLLTKYENEKFIDNKTFLKNFIKKIYCN